MTDVLVPANERDIVQEDGGEEDSAANQSLMIPITSSTTEKGLYIEIFPEEMPDTPSSTLLQVLKDENAPLHVWADAALLYIQHKQHAREASAILQAACERMDGTVEERVRLFASAGIAHLTQADQSMDRSESDPKEELRSLADNRFTHSSTADNLYPMTWMGKGMLNLSAGRLEQAKFFFDTTLKECGRVLPALLGLAAVMYLEKNYEGAQGMYAEAMRLYPRKSGAATRVGFGLACYRLGQVDRAKAAFARALEIDPENVDAMVGSAVLDMASLDETSVGFNSQMEKAIKMMSMANLLDHSNAMVQNHLANHYFWKWTPLSGTAQMVQGSNVVHASQPIPLEEGERIRIGTDFETSVAEYGDDEEENTFRMKDPWTGPSTAGLKVWKKDYDRVIALAKGAYNSTTVEEIQAESLFFLGRVYHVRDELENAYSFYDRACKLAPNLGPARFGLAQTLIAKEQYDQAAAHLQLLLGTSSTATDALAILGLLEVKKGTKITEGLAHLRKAIDLDPLNPDLVLLEALALQQHETNFPKSLERYKKAIQLMERQGKKISFEIYTNLGVLCHETKNYIECLKMYQLALEALDDDMVRKVATLDNVGIDGGRIRHPDNSMFFDYVDTTLQVQYEATDEGTTSVLIVSSNGQSVSDIGLLVGDDIRIGESFESQILSIEVDADGTTKLELRDPLKVNDPESMEEANRHDGDKKRISALFVKRENNRLEQTAISIAFNLARLHEVVGRTLAAVELHKAILKRNPAYVNCYLRLACIAIDCGALKECAGWLKIAAETDPGNPDVLTLIGNLHLSLCDWAPAQQVFDGLLTKKVQNVEAYAMLSLGNIYFATMNLPARYSKHITYAADFYKKILTKDTENAYAANGLGTILAEKAELFKAKEVFNRVREVSGDTVADAHLNLGHVYLAQKRHPEALQMYQSYLKRTEDGSAPITSKSRVDDKVDVLQYIAFAYFDWARQTELFNNAKAAPADERYKKAMEHLELALQENTSKNIVLTYNLCMTKLQAANCVLQKLTRNIRRTAAEVEEALHGLQKSYETVEEILKKKSEGLKVTIATSMLNDFLTHCKSNIESAKSHLEDERKREEEANELRELQRLTAESQRKKQEYEEQLRKEEAARKQEERDRKARQNMRKVEELRTGWEMEQAAVKAASEKKGKKNKIAPDVGDVIVPDDMVEEDAAPSAANLFEDSDDDSNDDDNKGKTGQGESKENSGKVDDDDAMPEATQEDLFGDSSSESDEELMPSGSKRSNENDDLQPSKKRKTAGDVDD